MACYFAADTHLGLRLGESPREREVRFVRWLQKIETDCDELFLLGDIFDFWFEYWLVVPKGYVRVLGQLAGMVDRGVRVHFFPGNHDQWMHKYLEREVGLRLHFDPYELMTVDGTRLLVGHGERFWNGGGWIQRIFHNPVVRFLFHHNVHPDLAILLGNLWSKKSRKRHDSREHRFAGEEEPMVIFARKYVQENPVDYIVCGHLHTPVHYPLNDTSSLIILGAWFEPSALVARLEHGKMELIPAD